MNFRKLSDKTIFCPLVVLLVPPVPTDNHRRKTHHTQTCVWEQPVALVPVNVLVSLSFGGPNYVLIVDVAAVFHHRQKKESKPLE